MVEDCKDLISRKFKNKFKGMLASFNLMPKRIRVISIFVEVYRNQW